MAVAASAFAVSFSYSGKNCAKKSGCNKKIHTVIIKQNTHTYTHTQTADSRQDSALLFLA